MNEGKQDVIENLNVLLLILVLTLYGLFVEYQFQMLCYIVIKCI